MNWQRKLPQSPDWRKNLPDMKRFERSFQGFEGKAQGNWGKYAKYTRLWGNNNGSKTK